MLKWMWPLPGDWRRMMSICASTSSGCQLCGVSLMRLVNRHSKETIDLQVAKLPSSAYYALASVLYTGARPKRNKGGVAEIGIVPLWCRSCGLLRTQKQNMVRVDGCVPTFYVGELCCLLPNKREILQTTSIMKLL